ncbi:hypothetical protein AGROH133_10554 [Agrobacterium tumefaciens]|nr:hypothetical protein AGROH133_10554 [Agrobacterium tumefaciens]
MKRYAGAVDDRCRFSGGMCLNAPWEIPHGAL